MSIGPWLNFEDQTMRFAAALLSIVLLLSACGKPGSNSSSSSSPGPAPAVAPDNPGGLDASKDLSTELKKMMEAALGWSGSDDARLRALIKTLVLPNHEAWMKKTFGDDIGGERSKGYGEMLPKLEEAVMKFFATIKAENQTEITVVHLASPEDKEAKGAQSEALRSMKQPVALYTVSFKAKGESLGKSLWSFVYVDGAFRLMGK